MGFAWLSWLKQLNCNGVLMGGFEGNSITYWHLYSFQTVQICLTGQMLLLLLEFAILTSFWMLLSGLAIKSTTHL